MSFDYQLWLKNVIDQPTVKIRSFVSLEEAKKWAEPLRVSLIDSHYLTVQAVEMGRNVIEYELPRPGRSK